MPPMHKNMEGPPEHKKMKGRRTLNEELGSQKVRIPIAEMVPP